MSKKTAKKSKTKTRRMNIVDVSSEPFSGVVLCDHPQQLWFLRLMRKLEALRIEFLCPSLDLVSSGWRHQAERMLHTTDPSVALKLEEDLLTSVHVALAYAVIQGKIQGPVTEVSLNRQATKLEKLADWRKSSGDENADSIKARADAIRSQTVEGIHQQFIAATKKDYSPMAKLPTSLKLTLEAFIANGGTMTDETFKTAKLSPAVLRALIEKKLVEQTTPGTYRVVEKAITAEPTPEQKAEVEKATKPPKVPKEKKPKVVKPPVNPSELCLCGCGVKVPATSRFRPGHDAKLHSLVLKTVKFNAIEDAADRKAKLAKLGEDSPARLFPKGEVGTLQKSYLTQVAWMDAAIKKALDL